MRRKHYSIILSHTLFLLPLILIRVNEESDLSLLRFIKKSYRTLRYARHEAVGRHLAVLSRNMYDNDLVHNPS